MRNPNLPGLATEVRELPTGVFGEKYVLLTIGRKIHWLVKRKIHLLENKKKTKVEFPFRLHCRKQNLGVVDSAGSGHRSRRNPSSTTLTARSPFTSKHRNPGPRYSNTEKKKMEGKKKRDDRKFDVAKSENYKIAVRFSWLLLKRKLFNTRVQWLV